MQKISALFSRELRSQRQEIYQWVNYVTTYIVDVFIEPISRMQSVVRKIWMTKVGKRCYCFGDNVV